MTLPIDPARRLARLRRAARPDAEPGEAADTESAGLPANVDVVRPPPPRVEAPPSAAIFDAQLLGQDGQKRGLRGGPQVIDGAAASYNRAEWSGAKDRRARKGGITKTEI